MRVWRLLIGWGHILKTNLTMCGCPMRSLLNVLPFIAFSFLRDLAAYTSMSYPNMQLRWPHFQDFFLMRQKYIIFILYIIGCTIPRDQLLINDFISLYFFFPSGKGVLISS